MTTGKQGKYSAEKLEFSDMLTGRELYRLDKQICNQPVGGSNPFASLGFRKSVYQ